MNVSREYYQLTADEIFNDVNETHQEVIKSEVENVNFVVFPHVYPSHKFRTTAFVLRSLKNLVQEKVICDMGCGPGIVGLFALQNGAKRVIQADINPCAIENAKENNILNGFNIDKIQTYQSSCFDNIPKQKFDLIIFNMPYHCDMIEITDPLKYAFYDPAFASIKKFLRQAKEYSHENTQIYIAFSNKGDVEMLESIFSDNYYHWELWQIINSDQKYDNRIYRLTQK